MNLCLVICFDKMVTLKFNVGRFRYQISFLIVELF